MMHELLASPVDPLPPEIYDGYVDNLQRSLAAMATQETSSAQAWRFLGDAINLMHTLVINGICADPDDAIQDSVDVMKAAGQSYIDNKPMHLTEDELAKVRGVTDDFLSVIDQIPYRTFVQCHRKTEVRVQAYRTSKRFDVVSL